MKVLPPAGGIEPLEGDDGLGLVLTQAARRYAVTSPFTKEVSLTDDLPLVIQYEVQLQEGLSCGGAYVKVYESSKSFNLEQVTPSTPYSIMFGPDRCGTTDKVHFIIRWKNPITGTVEEKHAAKAPSAKSDKISHMYTLIIRPDSTFAIKIDGKVEREGKLGGEDEFVPPILPSKEIDDPLDSKPADWVDEKEIANPEETKPADWDESQPASIPDTSAVKPFGWLDNEPDIIADPSAKRPEDWDDGEDGQWEAPLVANPKCEAAVGCGEWKRPTMINPLYKGKWRPSMIANPLFKGAWAPRKIPNPSYFEDEHLNRLGGAKMAALGVEVWTMNGGITFDNFLVTRNEEEAEAFMKETFTEKQRAQETALKVAEQAAERERLAKAAENGGILERAMVYFNEAIFLAQNNPTSAILVLLITLVTLGGLCATVCCAPDFEPPQKIREKSSNKHSTPHAHSHGGHDNNDAEENVDEDNDDEDGEKSKQFDKIAEKFAAKQFASKYQGEDKEDSVEKDNVYVKSSSASNAANDDSSNEPTVSEIIEPLPTVESEQSIPETETKQEPVIEEEKLPPTTAASTTTATTSPTAGTTRQRKNRPQA